MDAMIEYIYNELPLSLATHMFRTFQKVQNDCSKQEVYCMQPFTPTLFSIPVVRLDQAVGDLELPEHAGTVLLFNITKIVETELTINIQIVIIDQNGTLWSL